jgi:hypothetical protein
LCGRPHTVIAGSSADALDAYPLPLAAPSATPTGIVVMHSDRDTARPTAVIILCQTGVCRLILIYLLAIIGQEKKDGKPRGVFFSVAAKAVAGRGRLFSIHRGIPTVGQ